MHIMKRAAALIIAAILIPAVTMLINSEGLSPASLYDPGEEEGVAVNQRGKLAPLQDALERQIAAGQVKVSLCLHDFATGEQIEIDARRPLYPASMIKTLLMLATLEQVEQGKLSLDQTHLLAESDKFAGRTPVAGSGTMQFDEPGTVYTIGELLSLMVSISDNVAANILFDRIGPESIRRTAMKLGLDNTAYTRKMYEIDSPLPSNVSTARDLTKMLIALESGETAGEDLSNLGQKMMIETADKERIGRLIGNRVMVANKVGTVNEIIGDMAILYFPGRPPAALTIIVEDPDEWEEAARLIGELAKVIVDHLQGQGEKNMLG